MKRIWIYAAAGAVAGLAMAGAASASAAPEAKTVSTPRGWDYEIRDGKRVPKSNRKVNADGSWREEVREGKCVTVKEKTAAGEYRESRRCD